MVSVCLADAEPTENTLAPLLDLSVAIDARFSFWEIILVVPAQTAALFRTQLGAVRNLRIFSIDTRFGAYRERVIAASEAIGDVIVPASIRELEQLDIVRMMERCIDEGRIIKGVRPTASSGDKILGRSLISLSRIAGFEVGIRDLQTVAIPRTRLNEILAHPDPALAMRFPPRAWSNDPGLEIARQGLHFYPPLRKVRDRVGLIERLLVSCAPKLLTIVSVMAGALILLAISYILYAVGAWFILTRLEPGWLTLSMVLSLIAFFLGVAILGLSLGLQNLIGRLGQSGEDPRVMELSNVNPFGQIVQELNVEMQEAVVPVGSE